MLGKLTEAEMTRVADLLATRLNRLSARSKVALPLGGISMFDKEGQSFRDSDLDGVLFKRVRESLNSRIEIVEVDAHINDSKFAEACVSLLLDMMRRN
ncbi:MAG: hypothetical protein A2Z18_00895 [Armatimonadetes bacterium RBG_16_58_9]|nr:MAG: hypothetical protein A2Z18_00895 [Armatimonadetes bacterium RBG_16_58_9]